MKNKNLLLIISILLLLPFMSAKDMSIEIVPKYYYYSEEVLGYSNLTPFTGISFDVYGKNLNDFHRILNITIVDVSKELKDKFSNDKQSLRISQEKLLFSSKVIDINEFNDDNQTIFIALSGVDEETLKEIYVEEKLNVMLYKPVIDENKTFLKRMGNTIWEDNPDGGVLVFGLFIIIVIFIYNIKPIKFRRFK